MKNISDRKNTLFAIMLVIIICLSFPVEAQTNVAESMTEFLFPEFSKSEVIMKNGRIESMMLNFNLLTEKMLYEADGNFYEILNPGMIDTIILQECKFVSFGDYFYEVLYDAPISLLVQHKGKLIPPGKPAGYGGTSQVSNTKMVSALQRADGAYNMKLPADYSVKDNPVFWVSFDDIIYSFVNKRQFLKIFPDMGGELKLFIKENRIKFDALSDMIKLIEHCNELNQ